MTDAEKKELATLVAEAVRSALRSDSPCSLGLTTADAKELAGLAGAWRTARNRIGSAVLWLVVLAFGSVMVAGLKEWFQRQ